MKKTWYVMIQNLKESLAIFLLSVTQNLPQSKLKTHRWLEALEPPSRLQRLELLLNELKLKKIIEKLFKKKE